MDIGTPAQTCDLLLATASIYTWVVSSTAGNITSLHKFNASASGTYQSNEVTVDIWNFRGVASGLNSTDDIAIAGDAVLNQQFILASEEFQYDDFQADGMLVSALHRD